VRDHILPDLPVVHLVLCFHDRFGFKQFNCDRLLFVKSSSDAQSGKIRSDSVTYIRS